MKRSIEVLQVFRGIAATAVVFHHAADEVGKIPAVAAGARAFHIGHWINTDVGAVGVDLFFVISGFIMSYTARRGGLREARDFMVRRLVRIYPLYWACSLIMIAVLLLPWVQGFHPQPLALFKSFVLYPTLYLDMVRPVILPQGWTLIYEMLFYLLFAVTLSLTRFRQSLVVFGALAGMFVIAHLMPGENAVLVLLRDQVLFEFVFGLALGLLLVETEIRLTPKWAAVVIGVGLLLLLPSALHSGYGWNIPRLWKFGVPAFLIIGGSLLREPQPARFPRTLVVLGDASYSIYLVHVIVFLLYYTGWLRLHVLQKIPPDLHFFNLAISAVALGVVAHFCIEKPLLEKCRQWTTRAREKLPAAA